MHINAHVNGIISHLVVEDLRNSLLLRAIFAWIWRIFSPPLLIQN